MSCSCDQFEFPPETIIPAGLTRLPRQTGSFAEFRRALLRAVSVRSAAHLDQHPQWSLRYLTEHDRDGLRKSLEAIGQWRGRHPEDFGMMLLEMWAYVCDLISFYDDLLTHEMYLRTARQRSSLRQLVKPLGYLPRPSVAALVELAALADGRQTVTLPVGTAFRSGAFEGNPPQVFELTAETVIHPLRNEWNLLPVRPTTFGSAGAWKQTLLCEPGTVSVKEDDVVLVKVGSSRSARRVRSVAAQQGADGQAYTAVTLSAAVWIPANTAVSAVALLKPGAAASLWNRTGPAYGSLIKSGGGQGVSMSLPYGSWLWLESTSAQVRVGQDVIIKKGNVLSAAAITKNAVVPIVLEAAKTVEIKDGNGVVLSKMPVPAVRAHTTEIIVEPAFTTNAVSAVDDSLEVTVYHSFASGGRVTVEALTELDRSNTLKVGAPLEIPRDIAPSGKFQLEDKNGSGLTRPGSLNYSTGQLTVQGDPWPETLRTPVKLFGNVITASRGETVNGEILGSGNAAVANQSFTLKKSPLTYLPAPSESTPSGLTSTLSVYVDGLRWTEVPGFYHAGREDEVYTVRQNDQEESIVTFGDGTRGRRLPTGAQVVACYRHGAGAAMPPAGSITQLARPVKGLKGVANPVAAYGGADAEPADNLRKYAPRSALLLGRAVSLPDLEAAAASYAGVRAVAAEWRWSSQQQVPAAHIWYLAEGDLTELIRQKLRGMTQPDTPIQVSPAVAMPRTLGIQMTVSPKRFEDDVLTSVRTALTDVETGLLPPERLGIGKPLFRSRLFEFLLQVPGVESVTGLTLDGIPFASYGIKADAGHYFDFSHGLILNGRTE